MPSATSSLLTRKKSYLPARSLRSTPDAVQCVGRQQLSYTSLLVTRQFYPLQRIFMRHRYMK
jgi:hypothetical protein